MDGHELRALVESGPLLGDGGLGTSLVAAGVPLERNFDALNLEDPDPVLGAHRAFAEAGAQFVETNTWGANKFKLAVHGLGSRVREVNAAGVELARKAGASFV